MAQHASDSVHAAGKLPPTLTPTGQFAGKPTLPISRSVTLIGSRKQARLQLISSTVSQNHALIVNADTGPYIRDLASRSHVFVNGQTVKESPLKESDEIQIGRFTFRFNESPQTRGVVKKDVEAAAPARMVVDGADLPVPIDGKSLLIGRREICDIHLLEDTCSTTHAIVFEMDGRRYIRDLASRTGTFVNGKQIHQVELMPGDEIKVGDTTMRYMADAAPGVTAEEEMVPTDLAADVGDLMPIENEAPVAPVSRAAAPATAARDAEDVAADALELVHSQPADVEPAEAAPEELEIEPVEVEEAPAAKTQAPAGEIEETEAPAIEIESAAPADLDAIEMEPLEIEPVEPIAEEPAPIEPVAEAAEPEPAPAPAQTARVVPAAPKPMKRPEMPEQLSQMNWAANQDQFLGGQPMALPPLPIDQHADAFIRDDSGDTAAEEDLLVPIGDEAPTQEQASDEAVEPAAEAPDEAEMELEPLEVEPAARDAHEPLEVEAAAPAELEVEPLEVEEEAPAAKTQATAECEAEPPPAREPIAISPIEEAEPVEDAVAPAPISIAPIEEEPEPEPIAKAPPAAARVPTVPPIAPVAPIAPAPVVPLPEVKIEPPSRPRLAPAPAAKKPAAKETPAPPKVEAPPPPRAPKAPEPARPAAEAPKSAPSKAKSLKPAATPPQRRRTPIVPDELPAEAFTAPVEELPTDFAAAPPVSESDVAEELNFDLPEDVGVAPAAAGVPALDDLEDITAAPIAPLPDFADVAADTIDFGADAALAETAADDSFALDESADEIAPLDLEAGEAEAAQAMDFDLGVEELPPLAGEPRSEEPPIEVEQAPAAKTQATPRQVSEAPFAQTPLAEEETQATDEIPQSDVAAEVIEPTDSTPQSAQALDEVVEAPTPTQEVSLTDSTFGRAVDDFVGESTGPIVEDRAAVEPPSPPSEAEAPARPGAPRSAEAPPAPPESKFASRFGPGASQLELEPLADDEPLAVSDVREPADVAEIEPADINGPLDVEAIEAEQEAERADREAAASRADVVEQDEAVEPIEAPPDVLLTQGQDELLTPEAEAEAEADASSAPPQGKLFDLEPQSPGEAPATAPSSSAEPVEVEPEPLETVHDDLEIEPVEVEAVEVEPEPAPASPQARAQETHEVESAAEVHPEPLGEPLSIDDEITLTQTPQAVGSAAAATPVDEPRESFELEPEPLEIEPVEVEGREAAASERVEAEPVEIEPVEVEAEAIETEPEPLEATPPQARTTRGAAAEPEADLEPVDLDALALESLGEATAGGAAAAAAAAADAPLDFPDISELESIGVEPEPVAEAPKPAAAPAPVAPPPRPAPAAGPTAPPIPTPPPAARTAPPPAAAGRPSAPQPATPLQPSMPTPVGDAFSWGANTEHFLGGQPLQLTPNIPPTRPQQQPPPQQRPPAAPSPFAGATPSPRPAPRRPMPQQPAAQPQQTPHAAPRPGGKKPPTPVSTGFDGLALGADGAAAAAAASAGDVFTHKPISLTGGFDPGLVSDVFAGRRRTPAGGGGAGGNQPPTIPSGDVTAASSSGGNGGGTPTPQPRPRRATKAEPMGDAWTPNEKPIDAMAGNGEGDTAAAPATGARGQKAAAPESPEPEAPQIPQRKKRRWFGLRLILWILLLPAMGAAAWGIWNYLPMHSVVTGQMKFANVGALPQLQRNALKQQQEELIKSPAVRIDAKTKLVSVGGKGSAPIPAGFIGDDVSYLRTVTSAGFDADRGVLTVRYVGAGTPEDRLRVLALLQAVYAANGKNVQDAQKLTQSIEDLTTGRADTERRMAELQKQIDDLTAKAQDLPTAADRTALEADAGRLESTYNAAVANVTKLTAELKSLREAQSAAPAAPAAATQPTALAPDDQLAKLQGELDQLNTKVGAIQEGRGEKAKVARTRLDAALESFNQQLLEAQGAVKNNPQLLAYLTDAHKLLDSTKSLTDQLIHRQQDQYAQLSELKARLNEKMLARRAEVWKKDPELVKLMDEKDIKTRQYNAAVGQNMSKEAAEIKTDLDYLNSSIRARQTVVADDSFYADAIDQLQKIIDTTQKGLEDDRKSTMQQLDEMQAMLARSQPSLDSLTPDQKELATKMERSLADVSQARKQYTESADAANKAADEEIRNLQSNASDLASKVAQRKQQIAQAGTERLATAAVPAVAPAPSAADRDKAIEQKAAELAAAEKTRADAEAAFFAANKKLVDLRNRMDQARQAGELRDKLLATKTGLDQELVNRTNALEDKKRQSEASVYPASAPTASDVLLDAKQDQRPAYILAACGALFGLCVVVELMGRSGGGAVAAAGEEYGAPTSDYAFDSYETDAPEHLAPPRATPVEV